MIGMDGEQLFSDMRSIVGNLERLIEEGQPPLTPPLSNPNVCKVKIYRQNRLRTYHMTMFEVEIDMENVDTVTYTMAEDDDSITFMEIDVYDAVKRHTEYLEARVEELEVLLEEILEEIHLDEMHEECE